MSDDDDLFATLGGSLMKDLLADLNDDADASFLSLEQLEKELAHLDSKPYGSLPTVTEETPSAASMVVAAQQNQGSLYGNAVLGATDSSPAMDAWSLSLQKFTAASLEEDFLQADSARKALQPTPPGLTATPTAPPGLEQLLSTAEEYDVKERLLVQPPPGMLKSRSVPEQAAEKLEAVSRESSVEKLEEVPPVPKPFPATPQNSMAMELPTPGPPTPQEEAPPPAQATMMTPPPKMMPPVQAHPPHVVGPVPPTPPNSVHTTPLGPGHPMMPPALTAVPVAVPLPQNQAWQASPMPPPPPPKPVYANPHPDAPPIPAHALATPFMTVRDISYVVHAILRPVLALGTSPFDYDQVYWRRRGQGLRPGPKANNNKLEMEMKSRSAKAKEWSDSHSTLGKSAKGNVARPRALIAQPVTTEGTGEEKQRQTLWKARIYCDQAYQAYMKVVEVWERSPGTAIPANLQPHLVKLLRCLGITVKDDAHKKPVYSVDPAALTLLLKLAKGRVLLARLLEQALLPPAAVQALLPPALCVMYEAKPDPVDDRVFAAWARVINSLPDLSETCLTEATRQVLANPTAALQSTSRMQAVHGLLRRGSLLAAAASDTEFAQRWSETEQEFMNILGGS